MTAKKTKRMNTWVAERSADRWQVWDENGIACICDVHRGVTPDPTGKINARLIAAAPDLLEACEAVAATTWSRNTATIIGEQVRAAIAKAKGEA